MIHRLHLGIRADLVAGDAVREAGEILDLLDVEEMTARNGRLQHQRRAAGPGGEQAGSQAGQPAPDDQDVVSSHWLSALMYQRLWCRVHTPCGGAVNRGPWTKVHVYHRSS